MMLSVISIFEAFEFVASITAFDYVRIVNIMVASGDMNLYDDL